MKTLRRFVSSALPFVVLALSLCGTQMASAACKRTAGAVAKYVDMNMGTVIIPNDLAVGATIAVKSFAIPTQGASDILVECKNGGGTAIGLMLQGSSLGNSIYSTAVPGVGIRLSRVIQGQVTFYPHRLALKNSTHYAFEAGSQFKVELIKTAAVTGNGPLAAGTYTRYYVDGDNFTILTTTLSGNGITIVTPSCTVDTGSRNISVQFGQVPHNAFTGKGSTAGNRGFNIQLNCSAGQNAQNTVYLRMDATRDPSNEPGVLKLTSANSGTATGVGIQILNGQSAPVTFGEDALVGPSKDGAYVLPYTARYYQTGSTVTAGKANGTATFTLDYK